MQQDWFLEEYIPSNHLVVKIHMVKLTCGNFIKFGDVQVFGKAASSVSVGNVSVSDVSVGTRTPEASGF